MKKTALSLALGIWGGMAVFFIALPVHAAPIILPLSQGQQNAHDNVYPSASHATWSIQVPHQTFTGTTTGAFVVFDTNGQNYDSNYQSISVTLTCGSQSVGWYTGFSGSYQGHIVTASEPTLLAQPLSGSPFFNVVDETCTVDYDAILVAGHPAQMTYYGQAISTHPTWVVTGNGTTTGVGVPYFAFAVNGFFIIPTTTDSGIFYSGAQSFCNDAFASSTGIGATIGNGLCIAGGFLFIPTAASLQQFGGMTDDLSNVIPFSYFYDVKDIVDGSTASSTQNLPAYSINLGSLDFASSTGLGPILPTGGFTFFSSSTINQYMPVGMHDFLYNLMIAAIWVEVGFLLYRRIVPKQAKI